MTISLEQSRHEPSARTVPTSAAVELTDVGVCYTMPTDPIASFKEYIVRRLRDKIERRELWALKEASIEIAAGETLGIIGRNGAGKSTLLKVVSRVLRPTTGRVVVRGRVAPLLELGAGFHFDLTGRENVFLNATLLGHAKARVEAHFGEVVEFSELGSFIEMPIRRYSSGMLARLGFAVATLFRPDLLILDEVLAVGDTAFQQKCLARIRDFQSRGTAILYVSHDLDSVREYCHRCLWLADGTVAGLGPADEMLERYREYLGLAKGA